ncbi:MAG TPA: elongation factor 4, partial [Clostridiales bacterium]|nr:elongation factor 4 [Clostridiales bacterium]
DNMDIERERGITIKSRAIRMKYVHTDGEEYVMNLIDTPGHVDFNYEVSRSLAACEGALLVVDASQGIEAQTLANVYLALDNNLEVIPVINKIDLVSARPEVAKKEIEDIIGLDASEAPLISAKQGLNIKDVLHAVVKGIPAPEGDTENPLQALIFDSWYDSYKGVMVLVRIREGVLRMGDQVLMMNTKKEFQVNELGYLKVSGFEKCDELRAGEVGIFAASIKNVSDTQVGDTVTLVRKPASKPLAGYRKSVSVVFCGIYPADSARYEDLKDALAKLKLNDASLHYEPETSIALGFGFRCGFLGLLHMEIIQERIEREFDLDIVTTAPSVIYKVFTVSGKELRIDNPTNMPEVSTIDRIEEPIVKTTIYTPPEYVGAIMELCQDRRGVYKEMKYLDESRTSVEYEMPLNEIIYDFFDALKSRTKGYASYDYEILEYRPSKLVKLDIMLNGEPVDALSFIVHEEKAYGRGRRIAEKLKDSIPRHMFEIPIQACIGGKIIARETISAMRKDVLAKCYGGDISRKKKLLEKQKEGKKRMRQVGSVEVPQEAFMSVLKLDS